MLLSVSVWSGNATEIAPETRDLFHWLSALIALPAAGFAGQPFFYAAIAALREREMTMDVPISLGVLLALGMSVRIDYQQRVLTLRFGQIILIGSALGFLGMGAQPPTAELGMMAAQGRDFLFMAPHIATIPSLAIFLIVLAANLLGDAVRDVLDLNIER